MPTHITHGEVKLGKDKPTADVVWRGKKENAVYPVNMTPYLEDGHIYAVNNPGQMVAVNLETGKRVWETTEPVTGKDSKPANSGTAFIVRVAIWAKTITPIATIHVTSIEFVTGNGPILNTVGAAGGSPSAEAGIAVSDNPAITSHKNVILINRIGH